MSQKIIVDVKIDDKGQLTVLTKKAKKTSDALGGVTKSAHSTDRALKGAARASSNSTKNFSKMAQGISGGLVPAYATLAATMFAVSAAFLFFRDAADVRLLIQGQLEYAKVTGIAMNTLTRDIQAATDGQIQFREAAQAAAIGKAAGLTNTQIKELGVVAKNASIALGRDLTDSFNRLVRGATKAEPELLDELGIILRLKPATEAYAETIGKTADELNAFERSQAVTNEVLRQGKANFANLNVEVNQFNKLAKAMDETLISVKLAIEPIAGFIAKVLTVNVGAATAAFALFSLSMIKKVLPSMADLRASMADTERMARVNAFGQKRRLINSNRQIQTNIIKQKELVKLSQQQIDETFATTFREKDKRGPTSGQAFLFGATGKQTKIQEKLAQKSFERSLNKAVRQAKSKMDITAVNFQNFTKKQVFAFEKMYKQMGLSSTQWVEKVRLGISSVSLQFGIMTSKIKLAWAKTMTSMTKAWGGFMRALNFLAIVGTIFAFKELFAGLVDQIRESFKPAEQKKLESEQKALIDHLTTLKTELKAIAEQKPLENLENELVRVSNFFKNISIQEDLVKPLQKLEDMRQPRRDFAKGLTKPMAPQLIEGGGALAARFNLKKQEAFNKKLQKYKDVQTRVNMVIGKEAEIRNGVVSILKEMEKLSTNSAALEEIRTKINKGQFIQAVKLLEVEEKRIKNIQAIAGAVRGLAEAEKTESTELARIATAGGRTIKFSGVLKAQLDQIKQLNIAMDGAKELSSDQLVTYKKQLTAVTKTKDEFISFSKASFELDKKSVIIKTEILKIGKHGVSVVAILNQKQQQITIDKKTEELRLVKHIKVETILDIQAKDQNIALLRIEIKLEEQRLKLMQQRELERNQGLRFSTAELKVRNEAAAFALAKSSLKSRIDLEATKKSLKLKQQEADIAVIKAKGDPLGADISKLKELSKAIAIELTNNEQKIKDLKLQILLKTNLTQLETFALTSDTSRQGKRRTAEIAIIRKQTEIAEQKRIIDREKALGAEGQDVSILEATVALEEKRLYLMIQQKDTAFQIGQAAKNAFEGGLTDQLDKLIQGTEKSLGDAFIGLVQGIAKAASRKIAESIVDNIMDRAFGNPIVQAHTIGAQIVAQSIVAAHAAGAAGTSLGTSTSSTPTPGFFGKAFGFVKGLLGFKNGGVANGSFQAFANGTPRITKPTLAILREGGMNEAVVPLPDGKSIPVIGAMGNNKVEVNIQIDANGNSKTQVTQDDNQLASFGKAIGAMIDQKLARELRPGGMLRG